MLPTAGAKVLVLACPLLSNSLHAECHRDALLSLVVLDTQLNILFAHFIFRQGIQCVDEVQSQ